MSSLETHIRTLSEDGLRIHIWPTKGGFFQANVGESGMGGGWTCYTAPDPIEALTTVLRLRATGASGRVVQFDEDAPVVVTEATTDPRQVDIEDAIAATVVDDFEDFL